MTLHDSLREPSQLEKLAFASFDVCHVMGIFTPPCQSGPNAKGME